MINKSEQRLDALRATVSALATAQAPNDPLIKRLKSLSEINQDLLGVIKFVERAAQVERDLGVARQQLSEARKFDMRHAGVRHCDLPDMSGRNPGDALTPNAGDPWAQYEQLKAKDPVAAQNYYDKHLRVHGRQS